MVRLATADDRPALLALWGRVFGDEPAEIEPLLDGFAGEGNVFVYDAEGEPAAMLLAVPCTLGGAAGVYHYALATQPELRGQGIMAALMAGAEDVERARGAAFAALIPASGSLFGFYHRHGYSDLSLRTLEVDVDEGPSCQGEAGADELCFGPVLPEEFIALRRRFIGRSGILFDAPRTALALEAVYEAGFESVCSKGGYGFFRKGAARLAVAELFAESDAEANRLLAAMAAQTGQRRVLLTLAPGGGPFGKAGELRPSAQIKALAPGFMPGEAYLRFAIDEVFDKDYERG